MILTEEQELIRSTAGAFAAEVLAPGAVAREKAKAIEPGVLRQMGEFGFLGMTVPEKLRPGDPHAADGGAQTRAGDPEKTAQESRRGL